MDTGDFESAAQSALSTGESLHTALEKQMQTLAQGVQSTATAAAAAWASMSQSAAGSISTLQAAGVGAWGAIAAQITAATAAARRYFSLQGGGKGYAVGLDYVPYNEFPARLHEGEAVLTKAEADQWRRGEGSSAAVKSEDLGQTLRDALQGMTIAMDGETVGRLVADTVSREIDRKSRTRRG